MGSERRARESARGKCSAKQREQQSSIYKHSGGTEAGAIEAHPLGPGSTHLMGRAKYIYIYT